MKWGEVSDILSDKKIPMRLKGILFYRAFVMPVMFFESEYR